MNKKELLLIRKYNDFTHSRKEWTTEEVCMSLEITKEKLYSINQKLRNVTYLSFRETKKVKNFIEASKDFLPKNEIDNIVLKKFNEDYFYCIFDRNTKKWHIAESTLECYKYDEADSKNKLHQVHNKKNKMKILYQ